jgi:hypothetical protein
MERDLENRPVPANIYLSAHSIPCMQFHAFNPGYSKRIQWTQYNFHSLQICMFCRVHSVCSLLDGQLPLQSAKNSGHNMKSSIMIRGKNILAILDLPFYWPQFIGVFFRRGEEFWGLVLLPAFQARALTWSGESVQTLDGLKETNSWILLTSQWGLNYWL